MCDRLRALTDSERRALQISELEILREFKRLCNSNHLEYYLTAGTLLGAVRHQGFIPWDDDIDIAMPRKDFDSLAALCREQLKEGLYYQDGKTETNYPYYFAKIRKHGTEVIEPCLESVNIQKGHYIDIFPLDGCPSSPVIARLFFKLIAFFTAALQGKVDPSYSCGYSKPGMRFTYRLFRHFPIDVLKGLRDLTRTVFSAGSKRRLCTVSGVHGYPAEAFDSDWFIETVELPFEGEAFHAPIKWHQLLTNMYGDYMKPPDESDRQGHFINIEGE